MPNEVMTDAQNASEKAASTPSLLRASSLSLLLEFKEDADTPVRVVVALEVVIVAEEPVATEGTAVGITGDLVGVGVGLLVGLSVGVFVGKRVGASVGDNVGLYVGGKDG